MKIGEPIGPSGGILIECQRREGLKYKIISKCMMYGDLSVLRFRSTPESLLCQPRIRGVLVLGSELEG